MLNGTFQITKENMTKVLFRKDANNQNIRYWFIVPQEHIYTIDFGVLGGKNIYEEHIFTMKDHNKQIDSLINDKRKKGYKYIQELKDNCELPVEVTSIEQYLDTYLPNDRTDGDNHILPMLAKTFIFGKTKIPNYFIGQWKINGLRCLITPYIDNNNLFGGRGFIFQSREGIIWNTPSLKTLEEKLLNIIPDDIFNFLIDYEAALDGELYIPGQSINIINSYVKKEYTDKLQFWCYDIAIGELQYWHRKEILEKQFNVFHCMDRNTHLNNNIPFILLPGRAIVTHEDAINYRDLFINLGFEGIILRDPIKDYQFGKRNISMYKYKTIDDGKFQILDIYPEGLKRNTIPLFMCRNDINNETFECHINGPIECQENILANKENYIGKYLYITYGERSGVNKVPFHIKEVKLL